MASGVQARPYIISRVAGTGGAGVSSARPLPAVESDPGLLLIQEGLRGVVRIPGGTAHALDAYSTDCLRRVWRAEHFSWWMTSMLHTAPGGDEFDEKLQLSQLRYVTTSTSAATSLAENYVGLDRV